MSIFLRHAISLQYPRAYHTTLGNTRIRVPEYYLMYHKQHIAQRTSKIVPSVTYPYLCNVVIPDVVQEQ